MLPEAAGRFSSPFVRPLTLPVSAASNQGTIPSLRAGLIAGFGADLLAQMLGANAREAIIVSVAWLAKTSLSRIAGRGLTRIKLHIRCTRIGLGGIDSNIR